VPQGVPVTNSYVYNNVIYNTGGTGSSFAMADDYFSDNGGIIDNNIISHDGSNGVDSVRYNNQGPPNLLSYSDYVITTGQNQHGSTNEPTFMNYNFLGITQASDLMLANTDTAARDNGIPVTGANFPPGWPFDFDGNPRTGAWDIGAYEYISTELGTCAHEADIPPCNNCVDADELLDYVNLWFQGSPGVTIELVAQAIDAGDEC